MYNNEIVEFLASKAVSYWKHIAREMDLNENQIVAIDRTFAFDKKIEIVVDVWLRRHENIMSNKEDYVLKLAKILGNCQLNKIKKELLEKFCVEKKSNCVDL